MVRDGLYDKSDTTTTTQNSDGSATQTTSYENPFYNALVTGASMLAGGSLADAAGQNSMGGLTTAENEALNNALSAKQKQLLAHAFSFEAQPAGSITQSDAANTLAALKLAQNDPSLTSTERGYFTSATLSVYQAGIQAGALSANNVGALVSAAIGSMAFSGGGSVQLPGGASQSNVLPTTSGSRTSVAIGNATNTPSGSYTIYPLGSGASTGPLPPGYTMVTRWVSPDEASQWLANQGTAIPSGIGAGGRVYVTTPGAPQPGGTGPVQINFAMPQSAISQAGNAQWGQIFQPVTSTPIYNTTIVVPKGITIPGH